MTNLRLEFCKKVRVARREAGMTQDALAKEVGCNQSALSSFEKGDVTKLSEEVVKKLADRFGIDLEEVEDEPAKPSPTVFGAKERGFCPNPGCPSNHPYTVDDEVFMKPDRETCDPAFGKYCAICGEVLEKRCPNCGAHLHSGAVCSFCGKKYITTA